MAWRRVLNILMASHLCRLVFTDETSFKTHMGRKWGRARRGQGVTGAFKRKSSQYTLIGAMGLGGMFGKWLVAGQKVLAGHFMWSEFYTRSSRTWRVSFLTHIGLLNIWEQASLSSGFVSFFVALGCRGRLEVDDVSQQPLSHAAWRTGVARKW